MNDDSLAILRRGIEADDGGRPLHFSRNVETARLLVERGAQLDPRDDDHDSTPAQWRIDEVIRTHRNFDS